MVRSKIISLILFFFLLSDLHIFAFQIDIETALLNKNTDLKENKLEIEKAGISLKKIFSDKTGDRIFFFFRGEAENNFTENRIDQLYAKYKGPMGRWNIAFGRTLIPFGLLTDYDTEWLIVKTQEYKTIGVKNDNGIVFSGFLGDFDYYIMLSQGSGTDRWSDIDNEALTVAKIAYKGEDSEDLKAGLSFLSGTVLNDKNSIYKKFAALDLIKYIGPLVSRNELVVGKKSDNTLLSLFTGFDYSLLPTTDINFSFNRLDIDAIEDSITLGMTHNTSFYGLVLRGGSKYYFKGSDNSEDKKELFIQIYKSYSNIF